MKTLTHAFLPTRQLLERLVYIILAFFSSLGVSPLVKQASKNPYNIENPLNGTGFNPDNNYITLIFIILATIGLSILFIRLSQTKFRWVIKLITIGALVSTFAFTNFFANGPAYVNQTGKADEFHSGEQLSPTHAYLQGESLYDDIFFLRGAGVDVIFPSIGASLFGESIGGFLLLGDLMRAVALVGFLLLLSLLIRNVALFGITSLMFYSSQAVSLFEFRDLVVWITIGLIVALFKTNLRRIHRSIILGLLGLTVALSIYISIDRGIGLLATGTILFIILSLFNVQDGNKYSFSPKTLTRNLYNTLLLPLGMVVGILIPAVIMGTASFISFIKMSIIEIPRFGGLLVSQPYPELSSESYLFWGPVFIAISAGVLLYTLYSVRSTRNFNILLPLTVVFVFSLYCLKIGSNRIDLAKLATATAPLFLVALILLFIAVSYLYSTKKDRPSILLPSILLAGCMIIFSQLDISRLIPSSSSTVSDVKEYIHKVKQPDDYWISDSLKETRNYIKSHTAQGDYIFAFTSNPIYYYVSDRRNPSRFYISWYADPTPYEQELLESLRRNPPKLIIYSDRSWTDAPDTISMQRRIPSVDNWILENFPVERLIGNTLIRERGN